MYQIITAPHPTLRLPTSPVNLPPEKLNPIIAEMTDTLLTQKEPEGVGLAANQVGLPYRLLLARFNAQSEQVRVFINPEIVDHSQEFQPAKKGAQLEGCLSLPNFYGFVKRWQWVKIKYQTVGTDRDSPLPTTTYELQTFTGFPAVIIQHEMDHLDGRIFVERILEQNGRLYKTTGKDKAGKEIWEEVKI